MKSNETRWPTVAIRLPPVIVLALAGCAGSPPVAEVPAGPRTEVTVLGGGFVMFEEQRVPLETFLYEVRLRVRDADGDPSLTPWVVIGVAPEVNEMTGQAMVQRLMEGLGRAGVGVIRLEGS